MAVKLFATICLALIASSKALVSQSPLKSNSISRPSGGTPLHLHEVSEVITTAANTIWLATIDGDIAAIPNNEFATVFAGGIAVMVGGVLSTMVVGLILDKGDLYANLAAESYLQSSDDEEFWKGLSDLEREKTEGLINKIKAAKGEAPAEATVVAAVSKSEASTSESAETKPAEPSSTPKDMFSDYGD